MTRLTRAIGFIFLLLMLVPVWACDDNNYVSQVNSGNFNNSIGSPAEDACSAFDGEFQFGVSSYGGVRNWALDAISDLGTPFHFLYIYILNGGMDNPDDFRDWYIVPFLDDCKESGATPVFSFYQLLDLGRAHGYSGSEPQVVQSCLGNSACMSDYFYNFVWFLQVLATEYPNAIIDVEPDSWGFMMWAMGVEGNDDPASVEVKVDQSGFPDVRGFSNDAGGLGKALLALRNTYAPNVRMGWHSSNFRVGTRPEVVASFFAAMGSWDLLVSEHFHFETDEALWWEPWDEELVTRNLDWAAHVTGEAGLPMLLWQVPVGSWDFHLLGSSDRSMIDRLVESGIVGVLFEHLNNHGDEDPDDYRAVGDFGTVPPVESTAGGTAATMRDRVTACGSSPVSLSPDSICD
ncbi:hypothetical protein KKF84_11535 [Myxococcota bacterium]|nr:hypothetical protein [Myxococcota bacterium]MBU1535944.1 hypothetical protein [Myxococcota bacterium]